MSSATRRGRCRRSGRRIEREHLVASRRGRDGTAPDATNCARRRSSPATRRRGWRASRRCRRAAGPASPSHARPHAAPSRRAARARRARRPTRLGARVVARLLQPEGVHAEHRVVAGHRRRPAGSARAMRSRSMRASPVKKSIWWPACSASASRGYSMATSSSSRLASCQRPCGQAAERCDMRPLARRAGKRQRRRMGGAGNRASPRARWRARRDSP